MAQHRSANAILTMLNAWLYFSISLLLPSTIYCLDRTSTSCGEMILLDSEQPTIEITSPNNIYTHPQPQDKADTTPEDCIWYLRSPPGNTIQLDLLAFEPVTQSLIVYDGPQIKDGDEEEIKLGADGHRFKSSGRAVTCRMPIPPSVDFEQKVSVTFQATLKEGEELSPKAVDPGTCGGVITLDQNTPTASINITNSYPSGGAAYCNWYFNSPPNTHVIVDFVHWQLLDNNDRIQVYDSRGHSVSYFYGRVDAAPYPVLSDSTARLVFDAYYSVSNSDFGVEVKYTDEVGSNTDDILPSSGGVIELKDNNSSITIQSMSLTSTYVYSMTNYWFLRGPVGKRLKLEFLQFDTNGYFYICDSYDTSRMVSKYRLPPFTEDRVFTTNSALVYLTSGASFSDGGAVMFTISMTDEHPGQNKCGATFDLDSDMGSFILNSPFYYSETRETGEIACWWYVSAGPQGKQVELLWLDVDTESYEYVTLYDHPSSRSSYYEISELKGSMDVVLSPFVSSRGGIVVELQNTYRYGYLGKGFLANLSISDGTTSVGPSSCGGNVMLSNSMPSFILNSPFYYESSKLPYGMYMRCYWRIHASSGQEVQITWLDIDTSYNVWLYDHLYYPYSSYRISSFNGKFDVNVSSVVSSRGGWVLESYDHFYYGYAGRTFLAEFSLRETPYYSSPASCGGSISLTASSPNVTFSTPFYYQNTSESVSMSCYWFITSTPGKQIHLTVTDLETETGKERVYIHDYQGTAYRVSELSGRLDVPVNVLSSRGGVTVIFNDHYKSDNDKGSPGMVFEARIFDSKPDHQAGLCGGTVALTDSSPEFSFTTPLYSTPSMEDVFTECWVYVTSPGGKQVQLTIRDFETISEVIIINDDPDDSYVSYKIAELSGRLDSQATMISSRGGLLMYYDDNSGSFNGKGAFVEAHIIDAMPSNITGYCGGVIPLSTSTPKVTATTPLFYEPSSNDVAINCWGYVRSPSGKQVEMSIHDFETDHEYLYVYDHPSSTSSHQVSLLRGNISDSTLVSTRGGFTLTFADATYSENGPGFAMDAALIEEFTWDDTGIDSCGQSIYLESSSPSIIFSTPNYPHEVSSNQYNCFWYLTCPNGYRISLLFHDFDTYSSSRFTIYDYSSISSSYQLARISSNSVPGQAAIQSSSSRVTVFYDDDDWNDVTKQRGVRVEASIIPEGEPIWTKDEPMSSCGSAITLTSDDNRIELTTPDYPNVTGDYYECTWFVQCPHLSTVRIQFKEFGLDSSGYLKVYDGPATNYPQLLHASGSSLPNDVYSNDNDMTVMYVNNRGTSGKGASFVIACVFEDVTTPDVPPTPEPEAHIQCDSTSMTVFLDRGLLSNGTQAADVHFEDEDCVGIDHDSSQVVMYTRYDMCSTVFKESETTIIYSNVITYYSSQPIIKDTAIITRQQYLKIPVSCELDRRRVLGDSFIPHIGVIAFNETGYGSFSLQLDRYTDETFNHIGSPEDEIILGEHLYFAVKMKSVSGLTVFLENCWATPSPYPNDAKSYTFLSNGCSEDPTMHVIDSRDPSFAPFVIDAFAFIKENPQVFIHCEALVCNYNDTSSRCAEGCQTSRVRRDGDRHVRGTSSRPHLISNGPLSTMHEAQTYDMDKTDGSPVRLEWSILIGLLACVTCLSVGMVAILLYMMSSRRRMSQRGYHRVNVMDDDEL